MSERTAEERAEVIRAIKEQHPGAGPGADVDLKIYSQKRTRPKKSGGDSGSPAEPARWKTTRAKSVTPKDLIIRSGLLF
jgi:hypothetical protein